MGKFLEKKTEQEKTCTHPEPCMLSFSCTGSCTAGSFVVIPELGATAASVGKQIERSVPLFAGMGGGESQG